MDLISLIVYLVVVGLIFWLAFWFIGFVGVPEPFNKVLRVIIGLVAFLLILGILLQLLGMHQIFTVTPLRLR